MPDGVERVLRVLVPSENQRSELLNRLLRRCANRRDVLAFRLLVEFRGDVGRLFAELSGIEANPRLDGSQQLHRVGVVRVRIEQRLDLRVQRIDRTGDSLVVPRVLREERDSPLQRTDVRMRLDRRQEVRVRGTGFRQQRGLFSFGRDLGRGGSFRRGGSALEPFERRVVTSVLLPQLRERLAAFGTRCFRELLRSALLQRVRICVQLLCVLRCEVLLREPAQHVTLIAHRRHGAAFERRTARVEHLAAGVRDRRRLTVGHSTLVVHDALVERLAVAAVTELLALRVGRTRNVPAVNGHRLVNLTSRVDLVAAGATRLAHRRGVLRGQLANQRLAALHSSGQARDLLAVFVGRGFEPFFHRSERVLHVAQFQTDTLPEHLKCGVVRLVRHRRTLADEAHQRACDLRLLSEQIGLLLEHDRELVDCVIQLVELELASVQAEARFLRRAGDLGLLLVRAQPVFALGIEVVAFRQVHVPVDLVERLVRLVQPDTPRQRVIGRRRQERTLASFGVGQRRFEHVFLHLERLHRARTHARELRARQFLPRFLLARLGRQRVDLLKDVFRALDVLRVFLRFVRLQRGKLLAQRIDHALIALVLRCLADLRALDVAVRHVTPQANVVLRLDGATEVVGRCGQPLEERTRLLLAVVRAVGRFVLFAQLVAEVDDLLRVEHRTVSRVDAALRARVAAVGLQLLEVILVDVRVRPHAAHDDGNLVVVRRIVLDADFPRVLCGRDHLGLAPALRRLRGVVALAANAVGFLLVLGRQALLLLVAFELTVERCELRATVEVDVVHLVGLVDLLLDFAQSNVDRRLGRALLGVDHRMIHQGQPFAAFPLVRAVVFVVGFALTELVRAELLRVCAVSLVLAHRVVAVLEAVRALAQQRVAILNQLVLARASLALLHEVAVHTVGVPTERFLQRAVERLHVVPLFLCGTEVPVVEFDFAAQRVDELLHTSIAHRTLRLRREAVANELLGRAVELLVVSDAAQLVVERSVAPPTRLFVAELQRAVKRTQHRRRILRAEEIDQRLARVTVHRLALRRTGDCVQHHLAHLVHGVGVVE